jgi:hypothetical protein
MQAFNARTNLVRRLLAGRNSDASLAALAMDREHLYELGQGWNADFIRRFSDLIDLREIDLTCPSAIEITRRRLATALARRRRERITESGSSFLIDIFPDLIIPPTLFEYMSELPYESVRLILIFFANMMKWTYFRASSASCPFCREDLDSPHFFECTRISPNALHNWSRFVSDLREGNFHEALERLFLVIQRWTILTNRFQPSLTSHLEEFFECSTSLAPRQLPSRRAPTALRWI